MIQTKDTGNFINGKLLLAMPGMGDPRFEKAVIYVCAHDENGAMGVVINKAMTDLNMGEMFEQLEIPVGKADDHDFRAMPVLTGGPVENTRGFILHSNDFEHEETIKVDDEFYVTGTVEALKAIASGQGPKDHLFVLGYAGWSPGQLEEELQGNVWLVLDPDADVLFKTAANDKWRTAISRLGIDPLMLSDSAGHA